MGVGVGAAQSCCRSKAPMSVPLPPAAFGVAGSSKVRGKPAPRWSVVRLPVRPALVPLSMAGLPQRRVMV